MTTLAAQSSQNLPRHSPHSLSAAIPLPFAPTLGGLTTNSPLQQSRPASRLTTPLAATPPPPLRLSASEESAKHHRKVKYAGVEHTLGPTFSDEEDGDDSTFIASKMAALGLDPNGLPYHSTGFTAAPNQPQFPLPYAQAQAQAQALRQAQVQHLAQLQQQQLLQHILTGQQRVSGNGTVDARALYQLQQAQQSPQYQAQLAHAQLQAQAQQALFAAHMQSLASQAQRQPQQQPQQFASHSDQRHALAAQVQANLQARTARNRAMSPDDADLRARFESAPIANPTDAYKTPVNASNPVFDNALSPNMQDQSWRSPFTPAASRGAAETPGNPGKPSSFGRFARPNNATSPSNLSALLARRRATDESSTSEPQASEDLKGGGPALHNPSSTSENRGKFPTIEAIGHGRPAQTSNPNARVWSTPTPVTARLAEPTPRAASYGGPTVRYSVLRQPVGPPGEPKELGEKNFQSRIRRQAGLKLGMLGRRVESPASTPLLA